MEFGEAKQRILQADGRRYSLRLEPPFWEALAEAAQGRGIKLGRLVADLATQAPRGSNLASQLRLFCLAEARRGRQQVEREVGRARLASGSTDIDTLVEICPAPCLVMTRERRILRVNEAFGRWYGETAGRLPGTSLDHFFTLRLAAGYEAMIAAFGNRQAGARRGHLLYLTPGRVVAAAVSLMPVARNDAEEFMVLIMLAQGEAAAGPPPAVTSR